MRRLSVLVLGLVACGDDGHHQIPDAPFIDDAPNDTTGGDPVTVTVTIGATPQPNVKVYFQNADSSVVSATMTDGTGVASAVMAAGGTVTAIDPYAAPAFGGTNDELYTWVGVKPGDHLVLHQRTFTAVTMTVIVPTDAAHMTATDFNVVTTCGTTTIPLGAVAAFPPTVTKLNVSFDACGTGDVMVVARDTGGNPLSGFYAPAQTFADGGTLDLHTNTYTAAITRTYTFNNYVDVTTNLAGLDGYLSAKGQLYGHSFTKIGDVPVATQQMPPYSAGLEVIVAQQHVNASLTDRRFAEWQAPANYVTDFGSHLLPDFATDPVMDAATHKVSWTQTGGAQTEDFTVLAYNSSRTSRSWTWRVVSPGGLSVQLPTLPTDVFDFNYTSGDFFFLDDVELLKVPGGYDAARAGFHSIESPLDFITGTTGVLSDSGYHTAAPAFQARRWP